MRARPCTLYRVHSTQKTVCVTSYLFQADRTPDHAVCCVLPAAPQLFSAMGSTRQQALLTHVIIGVVNVVTTLVAVFTVDSIGR